MMSMVLNRRLFLGSAAAAALLGSSKSEAQGKPSSAQAFPPGFHWGAATAAYQIEGAVAEDGRGPSIWDRFAHTPGVVTDQSNADIATDSYHRYREDVALLKSLNLTSYRFSIAWPRIQPTGRGPANAKGLDHYKRLADALLEAGIRPLVTLYHWDMPLAQADEGGWTRRGMVDQFTDYVDIVGRALGDRVHDWAIFNEPKACTGIGYLPGQREPLGNDPLAFLKASHVINLSQGSAFRALKAIDPKARIGGAYDVSPMYPMTETPADRAAAHRFHLFQNLWFLRPALTGAYPAGVLPPERLNDLLDFRPGDEKLVRADLDFVGLNYYSRFFVRDVPEGNGIPGLNVEPTWGAADATERTDYGWEVYPQGLYEVIRLIARETGDRPIEITENGAAYSDAPGPDGKVHDTRRIAFLESHLTWLREAIAAGLPVRGYHYWSLLDNFEWMAGLSQRFGLTYVDYANNQARTVKASGQWYGAVAKANRLAPGRAVAPPG